MPGVPSVAVTPFFLEQSMLWTAEQERAMKCTVLVVSGKTWFGSENELLLYWQ